jgi:hypothetical protein
MASFTQVRRILHIHPAHRTVGVSGVCSSFRTCRSVERVSPDDTAMRISFVSRLTNDRNHAAMAAFERILVEMGNVQCERLDLAAVAMGGLGDADCAVVFGRSLQIIGRWSAFDADAETGFEEDGGFETEFEIPAAARWHPVVDGVRPFIAHNRFSQLTHLRADATDLLVRKWAGEVFPVAWARQDEGRAFCTLLGHPEDFRQREFVRLLLNAIEWVRQ